MFNAHAGLWVRSSDLAECLEPHFHPTADVMKIATAEPGARTHPACVTTHLQDSFQEYLWRHLGVKIGILRRLHGFSILGV